MIVDCFTHIWANPAQLGDEAGSYLHRQGLGEADSASPEAHAASAEPVWKSLVFAFRSRRLGAEVPNAYVARYVASAPDRLVGVAAVDPTEEGATAEASELLEKPEFRALTISPAAQGFHPADSRAMRLYEAAAARGAPLFLQQGTHFPRRGSMEYARPFLLDEVAREHPDLTLVISSLGHPWIEEGIGLLGKHPRIFADIAGLVRRPWQAYNALVLAHQFNVMDKVLFGSDFPFCSAAAAIKGVYRLHEVVQGTNLPAVPREVLRGMVERDALNVLGIARSGEAPPAPDEADEEL